MALHPHKPLAFVMTIYGPIGIINYSKYEGQSYPVPFQLDGYYMDPTQSKKEDIMVSHDGNYLFVVMNSEGIFSIDIRDITKPYLFQVMVHNNLCQKMFAPKTNNNFVYLTNGKDLVVF